MANNRKAVEQFIINMVRRISKSEFNPNIYKNFFANMSDKTFDDWMRKLEKDEVKLVLYVPHFSDVKVTVDDNLKLAKELGHEFFQRIWIGPKDGQRAYLTPVPYLIIDLPVRRASQILTKKMSVSEHNRVIDKFTGQPTGDSKAAKISYPELHMLSAFGLDNTLIELVKYRGGDKKGFNAMNAMISKYGDVNLGTLSKYAGGVESTKTLNTFLTCMHIKSTL
jgi:hypothetical protein